MTITDLMTGRIHVDHHIPCARFDLANPEHQLLCFGYRNLKPMWPKDNIVKSDKVEHEGKTVRARDIRVIIPFKTNAA